MGQLSGGLSVLEINALGRYVLAMLSMLMLVV